MILLKQCTVFAPESLGVCDVFVAGGQICAIAPNLALPAQLDVEVLDGRGTLLIPGLVDGHVHITGGGGEGGPGSRTSELQSCQLLEAGVTSVVGCLGFDGITRTVESVLMKAKSLRAQGFSAWLYTGAYQVPPPTISGDVARDLALFDEIIGVGEVAIADRRSSFPEAIDLVRLARSARIGGMLGGCVGIVHLHLGDEADPFRLIHEAVALGRMSYYQFYPTHCTRNAQLFEDCKQYALKGPVDLTASSYPYFPEVEIKPSWAVRQLLEAAVPLAHISLSSDACGSLPRFDDQGRLIGCDVGHPSCLLKEVWDMVDQEKLPFEQALATVTLNPASILQLRGKGRIAVGAAADLVMLGQDRNIRAVISQGVVRARA